MCEPLLRSYGGGWLSCPRPAFWSEPDLTGVLFSSTVCLSAPENQEPGVYRARRFGNRLSLDSTHPGQTFLAMRLKGDSEHTLFSLPIRPPICPYVNEFYAETVEMVSVSVRTP